MKKCCMITLMASFFGKIWEKYGKNMGKFAVNNLSMQIQVYVVLLNQINNQ